MVESFKHLALQEQPFWVLLTRVNHFFQCEYLLFVASLTHQADSAESAFTQQLLHAILASVRILHYSSYRERHLFFQHATPLHRNEQVHLLSATSYYEALGVHSYIHFIPFNSPTA